MVIVNGYFVSCSVVGSRRKTIFFLWQQRRPHASGNMGTDVYDQEVTQAEALGKVIRQGNICYIPWLLWTYVP